MRDKKIDMQAGGYVLYGTTILTVQYRWTPSLYHNTASQPAQTPVCDAMASYMYIHDVLLYSCCCYAMPGTLADWTDQDRAGRYQGWRPCACAVPIDLLRANQST